MSKQCTHSKNVSPAYVSVIVQTNVVEAVEFCALARLSNELAEVDHGYESSSRGTASAWLEPRGCIVFPSPRVSEREQRDSGS